MNALFWFGAALVVIGAVWYAYHRGWLHAGLRKGAENAPPRSLLGQALRTGAAQTMPAADTRSAAVRLAEEADHTDSASLAADLSVPMRNRLAHLEVGNTIKIAAPGGMIAQEVVAIEVHYELMQDKTGWSRSGDSFKLVQLTSGSWLWSRGGNLALFTQILQLTDGQINLFKKKAQEFGRQKQRPHSVQLEVEGKTLDLVDIGMSETDVQGMTDAADGRVRFMYARNGVNIFWVQDRKVGTDVAMFGVMIEITDIQDIM